MPVTQTELESRLAQLSVQRSTLQVQLNTVRSEAQNRIDMLTANINAVNGAMQLCTELLKDVSLDIPTEKADDTGSNPKPAETDKPAG